MAISHTAGIDGFLQALNLDLGRAEDREKYNQLEREALDAEHRLNADRGNIEAYLRHDPSIVAPFTFAQLDNATLDRQTISMRLTASPMTEPLYARGRDLERVQGSNWVAKWMLYRVFTYGPAQRPAGN